MLRQILIAGTAVMMAFSVPAFAEGKSDGGAGASVGAGGNSAAHISTQGQANTNGPNAANRVYGTNRAAVRHAQHGLTHKAASKTKTKTKHRKPVAILGQ